MPDKNIRLSNESECQSEKNQIKKKINLKKSNSGLWNSKYAENPNNDLAVNKSSF